MPGGTPGAEKGGRALEKRRRAIIRKVPWNMECSHIPTKLRTICRLLCTLSYHFKTSNSVVATGGRLLRTKSILLTI